MDTGNPTSQISLTKSTAERINISRYPKHKDGFIIPVNLPGVGTIPINAFIEDRGANLISPLLFARHYDIEFSKQVIMFDPNRVRPQVYYAPSGNADVKPAIRVNIGKGAAQSIIIDTGADQNECTSVLADICKIQNYPVIHVPLNESLGKKRQAVYTKGYRVPVTIPGVLSVLRTLYVSDIRESNLSLLSAIQFLDEGYRLRYGQYGITFIHPSP